MPVSAEVDWVKTLTLVAVMAVLGAVVRFLPRIFGKTNATWKSYLKGQGLGLFLFLLGGAVAAGLSTKFGRAQGKASERVELVEFGSLNPAENPVYREVDTEKYSGVAVLTRTLAPQNGSATVTIFADRRETSSVTSEVKRLTSVADSWSRWDQQIVGNHMSFIVTAPKGGNAAPATDVKILVYLVPRSRAK